MRFSSLDRFSGVPLAFVPQLLLPLYHHIVVEAKLSLSADLQGSPCYPRLLCDSAIMVIAAHGLPPVS